MSRPDSVHLDPGKQALLLGDRTVTLQRKPYLILEYLIENRHRMVGRKELLDRFWDGKEVYDQSLSKAVGSIRKAFGETRSSSEFIETRWGLGYRYLGPFDGIIASGSPATLESIGNVVAPDGVPASLLSKLQRTLLGSTTMVGLSALAAIVLVCASLARTHLRKVDLQPAVKIRSLAVLPFTSHTMDDRDAYLGIGLADAIARQLGTASQFIVRSSSTVRSIAGDHPNPATAGNRLAVQAIVQGDIRRTGNKLVIDVRLLDGATGTELWSGIFNADDASIFSTEDAIAQQISNASLPASRPPALRDPGADTNSPEAYSKYRKAEFFAGRRTWESLEKAIGLLNEALLIDPKYARAYAALADCYQLESFYQFVPANIASPRAEAAARKALSLDDSIAEAHISLLSSLTDYDWDWSGAEHEFRAAISINPNSAVAYQYYGYALLGMARGEDALAAMKHAAELDPVSPSVQTSLGWCYYLMRKNRQAADQINKTLELYPDFVPARQMLGLLDGQLGLQQQAVADFKVAQKLEPDSSITRLLFDTQLANEGHRAEVAQKLRETVGNAVPDYYMAAAWNAAGDAHEAETYLKRGLRARSNWMIFLRYDPRFDSLREKPDFQALLNEVTPAHVVLAGR
jgi:TolB-like protein/DNA-binding winged helix-turn-helix (wHTH) protein/Tfp pilus assembly protein PilF